MISPEQLGFVTNFFDTMQRPAFVLALDNAKCAAIAATIERFRFLDLRPATIGAGEKPLFQFDPFVFLPTMIVLFLLAP